MCIRDRSITGILFGINIYRKKIEIEKSSMIVSINNFLDKKYYMDVLYEKIFIKNVFYEIICSGSEWIDKNIFDVINIGLSKLAGRLSFNSLKLQDGQIHSYSLVMVLTGVIAVFILVILG